MKTACTTILAAIILIGAFPVTQSSAATEIPASARRLFFPTAYENTAERASPPSAARQIELTYVGSTLWHGVIDCLVDDTLAYLAMYHGLMILSLADPAHPAYLSKLYIPGGWMTDLKKQGDYIYATEWSKAFYVLDVSDPTHPQVAGHYDLPSAAYGVDIRDTLAFVAYGVYTGAMGLAILNVASPSAIQLVSDLPLPYEGWAVRVRGDYAYVLGGGGMWVVDIADLTHPAIAERFLTGKWPVDLDFLPADSLLCIVNDDVMQPASASAVNVVNIADPAAPVTVSTYPLVGSAGPLALTGSTAFVSNGSRGLVVLDLSDPAAPDSIGHFEVPAFAARMGLADSLLVLADFGVQSMDIELPGEPGVFPPGGPEPEDLLVISIADPANPSLLGFYDMPGRCGDVAVGGGYASVTTWTGDGLGNPLGPDLQVVDVSDPTNPFLVGEYTTTGTGFASCIRDTLVYMAAGNAGLELLDISDATQPHPVGSYTTPAGALDVEVQGHYAFLGLGTFQGLISLNVSNPAYPTLSSQQPIAGAVIFQIALVGNWVYLPLGDRNDIPREGAVVRVSDPENIVVASFFGPPCDSLGLSIPCSRYNGIDANDRYVAVSVIPLGVAAFSVADNPEQPQYLGPVGLYGAPMLVDNHLFASAQWDGIVIIDLTTAPDFQVVGSYNTPGIIEHLCVEGRYLYVGDHWGLVILELPTAVSVPDPESEPLLPANTHLHQNYPNPFNPSTLIAYDLPQAAFVRLRVRNILGQEIVTLVNGRQSPGGHEVQWDGRGASGESVASGVYFYQLEVDGQPQTRKMLLLR